MVVARVGERSGTNRTLGGWSFRELVAQATTNLGIKMVEIVLALKFILGRLSIAHCAGVWAIVGRGLFRSSDLQCDFPRLHARGSNGTRGDFGGHWLLWARCSPFLANPPISESIQGIGHVAWGWTSGKPIREKGSM